MHVPEMFSDHGMFTFLYALMEMTASVDNISVGISSLFTNVPLDETIHILADEAFKDTWFNKIYNISISKDDPIELLSVATKSQLF